jgi:hypothetical protein
VGCWWGGPWSFRPGSSRGVAFAAAVVLVGDQVVGASRDLASAGATADPGSLAVACLFARPDDGEVAEWLTCEVSLFHGFPGAGGLRVLLWWGLRGGPGHDPGACPLHPERCCSVVTPGSGQGLVRRLPTYPAGRLPTYRLPPLPVSPLTHFPASPLTDFPVTAGMGRWGGTGTAGRGPSAWPGGGCSHRRSSWAGSRS